MDGEQLSRMESFIFEVPGKELMACDAETSQAIHDLVWKLSQEDARLHRLLPTPPQGYHWHYAIERDDNVMSNMVTFRVVATLQELM